MVNEINDTAKESAKAVQEVAKTTSDAICLTDKFSNFLGRIFGPSLQDIGDVAHLKTQYWKLKNAVAFQEKVERLLEERGVENIKHINARVGIPLIEAAVNEDRDELQELWAQLMASTISPESFLNAQRSHIEALKEFEPKDAETLSVLRTLFSRALSEEKNTWAKIGNYNELVRTWRSIRNLERLRIIELAKENEKIFSSATLDISEIVILILEEAEEADGKIINKLSVVVRFTTFD